MRFCIFVLFSLFISTSAMADDALYEELSSVITQFLPDVEIDSVKPTPIAGLYQVLIGADVIYITRDGGYVVKGEILDIFGQRNITEDVREDSRKKLLDELNENEYIEFTGKDAHDAIYVFTDVDCGYCRKFHRDVPELNAMGISVRYLAYPRSGVKSAAGKEMSDVWCSENRQEALTAVKNRKSIAAKKCDDPVAEQYSLGQKMGLRGTPSIYLQDGRNLPGYWPPDEIEKQLKLR